MSLCQYSDDHEKNLYYSLTAKHNPCDSECEDKWEDWKGNPCCKDHHDDPKKECEKKKCDSDSARALKRILSLLDDLNCCDLKTLEEIIDRLLCSRSCPKEDKPCK